MHSLQSILVFTLLFVGSLSASPLDFQGQVAARAAIERVYHSHRIGTPQTFEEAYPRALLERQVATNQRKLAALGQMYGVSVTEEMLAGEVARIEASTRAPEMLAEIKKALGGDSVLFAICFARPILVERALRERFVFDDNVHLSQRREADLVRAQLLAGDVKDEMQETVFQLSARPESDKISAPTAPVAPVNADGSSRSYSVEATVQLAQVLSAPQSEVGEPTLYYFEDLHPELQKILAVQLKEPGDVSAVVEMPQGFVIYQAKERTAETLTAASISLPKVDYNTWLATLDIDLP